MSLTTWWQHDDNMMNWQDVMDNLMTTWWQRVNWQDVINNLMTTWLQRVNWQDVIDNLMTTWWQHEELTRCHGQPEDNGSLWQVNSCGHKPGMSHFYQNDKYQPIKTTCPFLFLSEPSILTLISFILHWCILWTLDIFNLPGPSPLEPWIVTWSKFHICKVGEGNDSLFKLNIKH